MSRNQFWDSMVSKEGLKADIIFSVIGLLVTYAVLIGGTAQWREKTGGGPSVWEQWPSRVEVGNAVVGSFRDGGIERVITYCGGFLIMCVLCTIGCYLFLWLPFKWFVNWQFPDYDLSSLTDEERAKVLNGHFDDGRTNLERRTVDPTICSECGCELKYSGPVERRGDDGRKIHHLYTCDNENCTLYLHQWNDYRGRLTPVEGA